MTPPAPPPHGDLPVLARGRPLGEGSAVVILLHGRNASPADILTLAPALERPDVTYLAPTASGGTWYPQSFLAPIAQNEPGISSAVAVVHGLIETALAAGVSAERVVLLGFSQGACLTLTAAQRRPDRYGGVIAFTGGLIGPPGTVWDEAGSFGGTPVFLGASDHDPHVPEARVQESAAVFERMGASVTARIYPGMGHTVNEDELAFARALLSTVAGA
jgi:phospholipase/carboxylesterase/glyoxalase family protein